MVRGLLVVRCAMVRKRQQILGVSGGVGHGALWCRPVEASAHGQPEVLSSGISPENGRFEARASMMPPASGADFDNEADARGPEQLEIRALGGHVRATLG